MSRKVVLDTETTGIDVGQGHRIIEVGCVELVARRLTGRRFHAYVNPDRAIDFGAQAVHGLDIEFLRDKPRFAEIADELLGFLEGAELVIHNADFDLGFLDVEFARLASPPGSLRTLCGVIDTLALARNLYPGQRNSLDALCRRLGVDASARTLHGALLDAELLAQVYLAMTAGQSSLDLVLDVAPIAAAEIVAVEHLARHVRRANAQEIALHEAWLDALDRESESGSVWRRAAAAVISGSEPATP